jgi:hypothetical protein
MDSLEIRLRTNIKDIGEGKWMGTVSHIFSTNIRQLNQSYS